MDNYKQLLKILNEYEKTKFWKIINSDDIFEVDGVYVSILGGAGTALGMAIYENDEELNSQIDVTFGDHKYSPDNCIRPKWFEICLEDYGNLMTEEARKILKRHNIKSKNYVCKLESGKLPRLITENEAKKITQIIEKVILIAKYFKQEKLPLPKNIDLETMYSFTVTDNKVTHKKIKYPNYKETYDIDIKLDQEQLNKLRLTTSKSSALEIVILYSPTYINEESEGYYPYMLVVCDSRKKQVKAMELIAPTDLSKVPNKIIELLQKTKQIPKRITVNDELTKYLVKNIAEELDIKLFVNANLEFPFYVWKRFECDLREKW